MRAFSLIQQVSESRGGNHVAVAPPPRRLHGALPPLLLRPRHRRLQRPHRRLDADHPAAAHQAPGQDGRPLPRHRVPGLRSPAPPEAHRGRRDHLTARQGKIELHVNSNGKWKSN